MFALVYFTHPVTHDLYTLSLHDALPISSSSIRRSARSPFPTAPAPLRAPSTKGRRRLPSERLLGDRKSTRLNSSHLVISYAVFCLKKKKNRPNDTIRNDI